MAPILSWFDWMLVMRCDEPEFQCMCGLKQSIAYMAQDDPDYRVARISSYPRYFKMQTLDEAMTWTNPKLYPSSEYADLALYYNNQARVWIHELFHMNWVSTAGIYGDNDHIVDMILLYQRRNRLDERQTAYGPLVTKALVRAAFKPGFLTIINSDNLAL